ncbi:LysM domain-containing protein [Limnohabitans sp. TS-CS-82]|uniref:LysM peptidoglycan-binding domain-containing protein n=1 Tax=Limnohabitans sp. TS-CS-82 TaxID=2094193 RepID=UPI0011B03EF7|nr:LysM domain-containing protein [Limnohabitans sp. TS-CS-82]
MRLDPSFQPQVNTTDINGKPSLPVGSQAFTRAAPAFTRALSSAQTASNTSGALAPEGKVAAWDTSVKSGQTLSGIVREQMASRGVNVSNNEALRLAQTVARANNLPNANLIHPGQRLNLDSLNYSVAQAQTGAANAQVANASPNATAASTISISTAAALSALAANASSPSLSTGASANAPAPLVLNGESFATPLGTSSLAGTAQIQLLSRADRSTHPVLEKTIARAVEKGFIPAEEKQAVMNKIVQMSQQHKFAPDDFARLSLMESDGLNPKATNNRCHGIIQFCDGPDRGAASAGFGANPKAILGHSVLQQLDMVGKYFDDTGLKNNGPVGLDDLYLTVLTPAARNETRPNAPLNIPGRQAAYLHVNRDVRSPITRNSIVAGLHQNAKERLGTDVAQRATPQAARMSAYATQAVVTQVQ